MANQPETTSYDAGVYQIELTDPVQGGVGGLVNKPLLNLANRTNWLYAQVVALQGGASGLAPINSPAFTGSPTAPTAAVGDNSTKIANTAFVQQTVNGALAVSVAGGVNVSLVQSQWGYPILIFTGALTANISVIFPTQGGHWIVENNTTGAFGLTAKTAAGTGVVITQGKSSEIFCDGTNILLVGIDNTALSAALAALLASNNVWTGTNKFTKQVSSPGVAVTFGSPTTIDFSTGVNFNFTATSNFTLANPTNAVDGQAGAIDITQDGTGSRVITWGANWIFPGGVKPALSTAAGAVDVLSYRVRTDGKIYAILSKAFS